MQDPVICLNCGRIWSIKHTCAGSKTVGSDDKGATETTMRTSLLREAESLVVGDRNNSYGAPHQDFARSAGCLTALGYSGPDGRPMEAHDIAIIVTAIKLSRLMVTPKKRDSWVDIAGYAACGYEAAELTLESS